MLMGPFLYYWALTPSAILWSIVDIAFCTPYDSSPRSPLMLKL